MNNTMDNRRKINNLQIFIGYEIYNPYNIIYSIKSIQNSLLLS